MVRTQQLFSILKPLPNPRRISLQKEGEMSRPIDFSTIPDDELKVANTSVLVLNAYITAMTLGRDERKAFDAAVRAWRERNPNASPEQGPPAVATIICHNL